jgi:hypothetical protein
MAFEYQPDFSVPLIGSECLRTPSLKCLDDKGRERYIPMRAYEKRRQLDGVKRDWVGTPYQFLIAETIFDVGACEYGYTVARTDYFTDGKVGVFIRLYRQKQKAVRMFMEVTGESYDGP